MLKQQNTIKTSNKTKLKIPEKRREEKRRDL